MVAILFCHGGAAATLMGLLFVVVSLDARSALGMHQDSRRLAEQAIQNYLVVLLIALLVLVPSLNNSQRGFVALMLTAMRGVSSVVCLYWSALRPHERSSRLQSLRRHLLSIAGFALLIYAALVNGVWSG